MPSNNDGCKSNYIGKDKDLGESKSNKQKEYQPMSNKKLFLDLTLEQKQKDNQPDKSCNAIG